MLKGCPIQHNNTQNDLDDNGTSNQVQRRPKLPLLHCIATAHNSKQVNEQELTSKFNVRLLHVEYAH
jgi:hypothetical protein